MEKLEKGSRIQTSSKDKIKVLQKLMEFEQGKLRGDVPSETWIEVLISKLVMENGMPQ